MLLYCYLIVVVVVGVADVIVVAAFDSSYPSVVFGMPYLCLLFLSVVCTCSHDAVSFDAFVCLFDKDITCKKRAQKVCTNIQ